MFVDVSRPTSDEMKDARLSVFAKHRIEFDGFSHLHIPWIPGCGAKISIVGPGPMTGRSHSWLASGILCAKLHKKSAPATNSKIGAKSKLGVYQPVLTIINQYEPLLTSMNHYKPVWTIINQYEPLLTSMNQY